MRLVARARYGSDHDIEVVQAMAHEPHFAAGIRALAEEVFVFRREGPAVRDVVLGIRLVQREIRGAVRFAAPGERRGREKLEAQPQAGFTRRDGNGVVLAAVVAFDDVAYAFEVSDQVGRAARCSDDFLDDLRQKKSRAHRLLPESATEPRSSLARPNARDSFSTRCRKALRAAPSAS